ncbi:MAG: cell division protein ZapB [Desulfobacteraceae bacterium]|nr:cell division protein ZapB [Desulfobacteraceae bacterium]
MEDNELQVLEEKIGQLVRYCEELRAEKRNLIKKNDELSVKVGVLEENLAQIRAERETIRNKVTDLISKIDQLGPVSPEMREVFGGSSLPVS